MESPAVAAAGPCLRRRHLPADGNGLLPRSVSVDRAPPFWSVGGGGGIIRRRDWALLRVCCWCEVSGRGKC